VENNLLAQQRYERISELSRRTGVPLEQLNKAETPDDLAFLVAEYKDQRLAGQVKEETDKAKEKAKANKVDLGGGKPHESDSTEEALFKKAKGDPIALARLLIRTKGIKFYGNNPNALYRYYYPAARHLRDDRFAGLDNRPIAQTFVDGCGKENLTS